MESLRLLENSRDVSTGFNTDYNDEFTQEFPIGASVRVKLPDQGVIRTGLQYNPTAINRKYTTITFDAPFGADFEFDSVQTALQTERGRERFKKEYIETRMALIKSQIDRAAAKFAYQHTPNIVGVLGTDPSALSVFNQARQILIERAGWDQGKKINCIPPAVNTSLVPTGAGLFNPPDAISKQYREGAIGTYAGAEWFESMSLWDHTAGTWQTAASVTVKGASQSGSSLLVNCTSGDTFKAGDVIGIASVYPVNPLTKAVVNYAKTMTVTVLEDVTATTTSATLSISPALYGPEDPVNQNVDALPGNAALLTLFPGTSSPNGKKGKQGLLFNKGAFALVGAKLEIPQACEMSSQQRDPDSGVAVAFVRMFDPIQRRMVNRFDAMIGFGELRPANCAVRILCA